MSNPTDRSGQYSALLALLLSFMFHHVISTECIEDKVATHVKYTVYYKVCSVHCAVLKNFPVEMIAVE